MTDIVDEIQQSQNTVRQAQKAHRATMTRIEAFIRPLWEEYLREFGALGARAEEAGIPWREHVPVDGNLLSNSWGNAGLAWIGPDASYPDDSDMMCITTLYRYSGETSESELNMPRRFMSADGGALIRAEAARLGAELDEAIAAKQEDDAKALEAEERETFERLSVRFGKQEA